MRHPLSGAVLFSFVRSGYQLGCTVAAVSAQRPLEHGKNALQNITTEWMTHSVLTLDWEEGGGGGPIGIVPHRPHSFGSCPLLRSLSATHDPNLRAPPPRPPPPPHKTPNWGQISGRLKREIGAFGSNAPNAPALQMIYEEASPMGGVMMTRSSFIKWMNDGQND